jgi:hypothetical protein
MRIGYIQTGRDFSFGRGELLAATSRGHMAQTLRSIEFASEPTSRYGSCALMKSAADSYVTA